MVYIDAVRSDYGNECPLRSDDDPIISSRIFEARCIVSGISGYRYCCLTIDAGLPKFIVTESPAFDKVSELSSRWIADQFYEDKVIESFENLNEARGSAFLRVFIFLEELFTKMNEGLKMSHFMELGKNSFYALQAGTKTFECRLNDEDCQQLQVGDKIIFSMIGDPLMKLKTRVVGLHWFNTFKEMYQNLPLLKCGYTKENIKSADPSDMEKNYTSMDQVIYGVVGIELELLNDVQE